MGDVSEPTSPTDLLKCTGVILPFVLNTNTGLFGNFRWAHLSENIDVGSCIILNFGFGTGEYHPILSASTPWAWLGKTQLIFRIGFSRRGTNIIPSSKPRGDVVHPKLLVVRNILLQMIIVGII